MDFFRIPISRDRKIALGKTVRQQLLFCLLFSLFSSCPFIVQVYCCSSAYLLSHSLFSRFDIECFTSICSSGLCIFFRLFSTHRARTNSTYSSFVHAFIFFYFYSFIRFVVCVYSVYFISASG